MLLIVPAAYAALAGLASYFLIDKFAKPKVAVSSAAKSAVPAGSTPAEAAQTLADPIKLSNLVDKLPASAVDPGLVAALAANQGAAGFTATAQLANATADALAQAQAAALAAPSDANNAVVVQAALNNAAATAAEDQSNLDENGNPIVSGVLTDATPNFARRFRTLLVNSFS